MKKYPLYIALSLFLLSGTSCESFLETPPRSTQTADQFYNDEKEAQNAVNGLYSWLGNRFNYMAYGESPAFMLEYPTGQGRYSEGQQSLSNPDFEKLIYWDRGYVDQWWYSSYYTIEACNMALDGISLLPESENLKKMKGEAYFLRAYSYFNLVRIFGDVPLKLTKTEKPADGMIGRTSVKEIYEQAILPSLAEAEKSNLTNLPSSGRVSMAAVKSLMAQVYLTMAGAPLNETDKYALAAQKAKDVVTTSQLSLFKSEGDLTWFEKFRNMEYDNGSEYVFMANYGPSPAPRQHYSQFLTPVGVDGLTGFVGFGSLMPTAEFIKSYEDGDLRAKEKGFFFSQYQDKDDATKSLTFETSIYKFFEPTLVGQGGNCGKSLPLIRFAEILLTYAEAQAQSGSIDDTAVNAVNQIRERAGLPPISDRIKTNKELFIDEVRKQRVYELCFENVAFFDMIRTQKAFDMIQKAFVPLEGYKLPKGATFSVAKHSYFPIPLREIQINPELGK